MKHKIKLYDEENKSLTEKIKNQKSNLAKNDKIYIYKITIFILSITNIIFIYLYYINKSEIKKSQYSDEYSNEMKELIENVNKLKNSIKNITDVKNKAINLLIYLSPKDVIGYKKIRVGKKKDGGYVMIDDFNKVKIAYSFGINYEYEWDSEIGRKGIEIYMYDHTMNDYLYNLPKNLHFFKKGICAKNFEDQYLKTLNEYIEQNGHTKEKNMILKIDVEGEEWEIFKTLDENIILQFSQILLEIHPSDLDTMYTVLNKLSKTHQLVHIHCNNCCGYQKIQGVSICNYMELSYIIKDGYTFKNSLSFSPDPMLDMENVIDPERPEFFIGFPGIYSFE